MPCESLVSNSIGIEEETLACWQEKNVYQEQENENVLWKK